MKRVKITRKQQITIPPELFEDLGLKEGQLLTAEIEGGSLKLRPEIESKPVSEPSVFPR